MAVQDASMQLPEEPEKIDLLLKQRINGTLKVGLVFMHAYHGLQSGR